eukprot:sb/3474636/
MILVEISLLLLLITAGDSSIYHDTRHLTADGGSVHYDFAIVNQDTLELSHNDTGLLVAIDPESRNIVGTVCDDLFGAKNAYLVCQSMGYKCAYWWGAARGSRPYTTSYVQRGQTNIIGDFTGTDRIKKYWSLIGS